MSTEGLSREFLEKLGLGEDEIKEILVKAGVEEEPKRLKYFVFFSDEELERFKELFPEAELEVPPWRERNNR